MRVMSDIIELGEPDVIRNEDNILWLRAEIERMTAELFAAELRAKTYEEGYNESQEAIRYHQARVEKLEGALDKACETIETQPKVGSSIGYANGFQRGVQSQRMRAWAARKAATEQGDSDG